MYSSFVLTNVHSGEQKIQRFFEYCVYFWAFGDILEELINFVSISKIIIMHNNIGFKMLRKQCFKHLLSGNLTSFILKINL